MDKLNTDAYGEIIGESYVPQYRKVLAKLPEGISIAQNPIGKESTSDAGTKYFFAQSLGENVGGNNNIKLRKVYSISGDKLEEKIYYHKLLPDGKEKSGLLQSTYAKIFAQALTEAAGEFTRDREKLKEAAQAIEKVITVIIGDKEYEQDEKWGDAARFFFADGNNSEDAEEFARQLSLQLKILHEAGIVHYDLKSENILVKKDGDQLKVRIIDFDLVYNIEKPKQNKGPFLQGGTWVDGKCITSFSGRDDRLSQGPYQVVNDMKGYLYTLCETSRSPKSGYYETALEYLTAKYNKKEQLYTSPREQIRARTAALENLYKQGFGKVDNVDLFVRFICHFQGSVSCAFECYNHFKDDSNFIGQGQPLESFTSVRAKAIVEHMKEVIGESTSTVGITDENFSEVLNTVKMTLDDELGQYESSKSDISEYLGDVVGAKNQKILTVLIKHLKYPDEVKKYFDFIDEPVKTMLLKEIERDTFEFNDAGKERLAVIGLSIDIKGELASRWSLHRSGSQYTQRRKQVTENLLGLHHTLGNGISAELLTKKLGEIKGQGHEAKKVLEHLEKIRAAAHSSDFPEQQDSSSDFNKG